MRACRICGEIFDPELESRDPEVIAGEIMAKEVWGDAGELCPRCLAARGRLGMMYCPEFHS